MANAVELKSLVKQYGDFTAVHPVSLEIEEGSFVTLLGPSGCGKTTTLRMIAGLETCTEGEIYIGGKKINDLPIHKRNLGVVFQNYALFPHKNVFDNVAFGLKYRQINKSEIKQKVIQALERVRLPQMAERFPSQLSGGQQQRIALARAIVIEPDVLLLDEPLSALDANLRENMRVELKRIQRELGITSIFVTHDQAEALAMSDKVVIMSNGHIEQVGTPEEVYNQPNCEFVASFLGSSNIVSGRILKQDDKLYHVELFKKDEKENHNEDQTLNIIIEKRNGNEFKDNEHVRVILRAENLHLSYDLPSADQSNHHSVFDATVEGVDYQGQVARYFLKVKDFEFEAISTIDRNPFRENDKIKVSIYAHESVMLVSGKTHNHS